MKPQTLASNQTFDVPLRSAPAGAVGANGSAAEDKRITPAIIANKRAEAAVRETAIRTRRRVMALTELAVLSGLTVVVYALAGRFNWFGAITRWIHSNGNIAELNALVIALRFLVVGLLVFAFRRWRESENEASAQRRARQDLRVLHEELESRVKQRTTELSNANDLLRAEAVERTRTEATLRVQSAGLTAAANAIVITNRDGAIVWVNPAFTVLTGYTLAEAIGRNPRDLVKSGEQEPGIYNKLWETILAGRVWHGELVNRRKDGTHYSEQQTVTPVRDPSGEITHFIAIKEDLTERKLVEQMVHASRRQFQAVFEQAAVGMVIVEGSRGRFLNANRRFAEMVGYADEELRQLSCHDITHPDDIAAESDQLDQISLGVIRQFSREKRYRKKDGSFVWAKAFVAPLDPSEPQSIVRIGVVEDITERKRSEEALKNSEDRYRLLFESNPLPMWVYALDSLQFLAVNESAVQQYGYTREEFLAMGIEQLHLSNDLQALNAFLAERRTEGRRSSESRHRRKDGTNIEVEIVSRPLTFNDRESRLVLATDITEKKLFEEKFLHAQRLESIGTLAAGITHDLNNVLAPIMFAAPMLRESLSNSRDLKILDTLEQSAARGTDLVKQILTFARSASGDFHVIQVKHLARDVISVIEETFPKSIQLDHQIPSNLWPVEGNPTQIHQVLVNLCVNARDAMPEGGTLRFAASNHRLDTVEASAIPGARAGAWLLLEVADTGTGIRPEILARIWEPFFTTKAAGKGTGLGLSTVRGLVANHHGFVELHTEVGRGTTFRIFLPALETARPESTLSALADAPHGHGELVLVVEDDAAIRDIVANILGKHGYQVATCRDGLEALAFFHSRADEIALVVTDVDMPRLGGVGLSQALLQRRADIRLIAMSGLSRSETGASDVPAIRNLAHAFLIKPFTAEQLLVAAHRLLQPPDGV